MVQEIVEEILRKADNGSGWARLVIIVAAFWPFWIILIVAWLAEWGIL